VVGHSRNHKGESSDLERPSGVEITRMRAVVERAMLSLAEVQRSGAETTRANSDVRHSIILFLQFS
jgi:hypothetical protein